jgi:hypothetical protein
MTTFNTSSTSMRTSSPPPNSMMVLSIRAVANTRAIEIGVSTFQVKLSIWSMRKRGSAPRNRIEKK